MDNFENETYYLCLDDIDEKDIKMSKYDIISGSILNNLHIRWKLLRKTAPIPNINSEYFSTPQEIVHNRYNHGLKHQSIQQSCIYLPYHGDMSGKGYSGLHLITTQDNDGTWTAQINDWYGDRSQVDVVIYEGKDLKALLQGLVSYCAYYKIITEEQFIMYLNDCRGIKERRYK